MTQRRNRRNELDREVRLRRERRERYRREGERSIGQNLAMIGALGWLIVIPTLVGTFLGRWLDERFDSDIFWSSTLMFVGLVLGCYLAWQRMHHE